MSTCTFTEEDVYVVTRFRVKYAEDGESRETAINAALANECVNSRPIIKGKFSVYRGESFLGNFIHGE